jgi:dihydrodipicolinate synthase/N-acetylneuraminate lyase
MADTKMRGVFPILVTPFDEDENIDEEGLRAVVEYNVTGGVHGLGIALGSEIVKFTESERRQVIQAVVDQVRGRVPIVVNTGAVANRLAVYYSREAEELGASAVMCTPPPGVTGSETRQYFRAISDAVRVPVFIQDVPTASVSAGLTRQIAEESERVRYSKVESQPPAEKVYQAVQASRGLVTIFGGAGGTFLIEELRRGSEGTMPWPSTPHAFVRIWDEWHAGDESGARATFEREIRPLAHIASTGLRLGHQIHKEVLKRRGIIRTAIVRGPVDPLDELTLRELDEVYERMGI